MTLELTIIIILIIDNLKNLLYSRAAIIIIYIIIYRDPGKLL